MVVHNWIHCIYMCTLLIVDYLLTNRVDINTFYLSLSICGLSHTIMNLNCLKILENKIITSIIFLYVPVFGNTLLYLG